MLPNTLSTTFEALFNETPTASFFAPGRVNLIGEHIDYNGGLVFPCAITKGTYATVSKRSDTTFKLYSENFKDLGIIEFDLAHLNLDSSGEWTNYVKCVLSILLKRGYTIPFGLNIVVYGDLPNGAGLSSSASLELLMCKIFDTFYDLQLEPTEMALIGKQTENEYIGVSSGIMDQFAIALGKKDSALLLNCDTQKYEHIPFDMQDYELVIMNTNKRRELADSKYNERFNECQTTLKLLQNHYPIDYLCDLSKAKLQEIEQLNIDPILMKRLRHVISENSRVIQSTKYLADNDIIGFGKLLTASHQSLKNDYEVTGIELDTLVEAALNAGAIGARMTGAGFGGCAISLVKKEHIDLFIDKVGKHYEKTIGYAASFYKATIGNGPIQLN